MKISIKSDEIKKRVHFAPKSKKHKNKKKELTRKKCRSKINF